MEKSDLILRLTASIAFEERLLKKVRLQIRYRIGLRDTVPQMLISYKQRKRDLRESKQRLAELIARRDYLMNDDN